jgi:hypothetical protein
LPQRPKARAIKRHLCPGRHLPLQGYPQPPSNRQRRRRLLKQKLHPRYRMLRPLIIRLRRRYPCRHQLQQLPRLLSLPRSRKVRLPLRRACPLHLRTHQASPQQQLLRS